MPFQPVPFVAMVELIFDQFGQTIENTLYFKHTAEVAWGEGELVDLNLNITAWWDDNLKSLVTNQCTLREVVATDLTTATSPQISSSALIDGTNITEGLPTGTTWCISFRTDLRGRSYRGRNYYIGLTELQVTEDSVSPTPGAAIVESYGLLQSYVDAMVPNVEWVVVSREQNGVQLSNGIATTVTSVVTVDDYIDSQRRRLAGRG